MASCYLNKYVFERQLSEDFDSNEGHIPFVDSISISDVEMSDYWEVLIQPGSENSWSLESTWTEYLCNINVGDYSRVPGQINPLPSSATELDFLYSMFPEDLLVKITEETNSYAQKILEQKPDPKWHDTTFEEMKAYIAANIVMGVTTAP